MKNYLILLLFSFLVFGCSEDNDVLVSNDATLETRDNGVWICHKPNGNNPTAIYINENAVEAHLRHGDVLLDADGDGYTSENLCGEGDGDDCDDGNPDVNPGEEEICGDGIDNNCDGEVDEGCSCIEGELQVILRDRSILYVYPYDQNTGSPQSNGIQWGGYRIDIAGLYNYPYSYSAVYDFNGQENTNKIYNRLTTELGVSYEYAAKICKELSIETGCDWYLPALGELEAMYDQIGPLGQNGFNGYYYWSSTEVNGHGAWYKSFLYGVGNRYRGNKYGTNISCRCVRR